MSGVLRIALTGGIGSGKSTVASKFQTLGVPVIDSDVIARSIVKPGEPALKAIVSAFGKDLLTDEGTLDRRRLRNIIFNDLSAKTRLENILHPLIYKEIDEQVSRIHYPYCLIVIPLLVETERTNHFDRILVVDIPEEIQLKRASNRDNDSLKLIEGIIKSQASREQRLKHADDIIDNNLEIEDLNKTIQTLHNKYLKLAEEHKTL